MASLNYLIKNPRKHKQTLSKSPALLKNPQKKAVCIKVFKKTPRKPNSATRAVARVNILSYNHKITIFIPGIGHNLKEFALVLICGKGGAGRDLPGVKYKAIRGKYDLEAVKNRKTKRSKYGVKSSRKNKIRHYLLAQKK